MEVLLILVKAHVQNENTGKCIVYYDLLCWSWFLNNPLNPTLTFKWIMRSKVNIYSLWYFLNSRTLKNSLSARALLRPWSDDLLVLPVVSYRRGFLCFFFFVKHNHTNLRSTEKYVISISFTSQEQYEIKFKETKIKRSSGEYSLVGGFSLAKAYSVYVCVCLWVNVCVMSADPNAQYVHKTKS